MEASHRPGEFRISVGGKQPGAADSRCKNYGIVTASFFVTGKVTAIP